MKYRLYSIFDRNAVFFGSPVQSQNDEMMRRSVADMLMMEGQKPELDRHMYARYPGDFDVYIVGEFDSENGLLSGIQQTLVFRLTDFDVK